MIESPNHIYPVVWHEEKVWLIDQNRLPHEYSLVEIDRSADLAQAIRTEIVRGAQAIGIAAAYGMYLGSKEITTDNRAEFIHQLEQTAQMLRQTRPSIINLSWAVSRMLKTAYESIGTVSEITSILLETAQKIQLENFQNCQAIGDNGLTILPERPQKLTILTYCNTGSLATAGYGTALGIIRSALREERLEKIYICETRPRLQGAKLTAWECVREQIPATLITDSMAAHCMQRGKIDVAIVGADRIAANGDTANKIGTYALSLLARAHNVPFYVAAPLSTVDFDLTDGSQFEIEERDPFEIYQIENVKICPKGIDFYNPSFDVTPAHLIKAIITELGAIAPNKLIEYGRQKTS